MDSKIESLIRSRLEKYLKDKDILDIKNNYFMGIQSLKVKSQKCNLKFKSNLNIKLLTFYLKF